MNTDQSVSFLIRVWKEDENQCVGHIEHIQTGRKISFTSLENLQEIIKNLLPKNH
ncbi:MAG: hypothetical protein AB1420_16790 [Bacillota bacterium]